MAASGRKSMPKMQDKDKMKIHPRTNLNGGDLVRSTFLVITFPFNLAFMATLVLALILASVPLLAQVSGSGIPQTWLVHERH